MVTMLVLRALRLILNMSEISMTTLTRDGAHLVEANNKMRSEINDYLDEIKPSGPYKLIGGSIVIGERDWPPMLKDNHAREATMQLVVTALNFYHAYGRGK